MYVVTQEGKKLPVDDSSIDYENEYVSFQYTAGLYSEDTILRPVWIVTLQRNQDPFGGNKKFELDFVKELKYDHRPTKEELLWAMSAYGLTRFDIVTVQESYELDMLNDDMGETLEKQDKVDYPQSEE